MTLRRVDQCTENADRFPASSDTDGCNQTKATQIDSSLASFLTALEKMG